MILLLEAVLTLSLSASVNSELESLSLEEVLSIGGLDNDLIFAWSDLDVDPQENIYVLDFMDYSLKKFNKKGRFLLKKGRMGQGPGEFSCPRIIRYHSSRIYVIGLHNPWIQVFDNDLNYRKRIPLAIPAVDLDVIDRDRIIISSPSAPSPSNLITFGDKGIKKHPHELTRQGKEYWSAFKKFERDSRGHFYLMCTFVDRIEKRGPNNGKLWSVTLLGGKKPEYVESLSETGPSMLPRHVIFKDIAFDIYGYVYILGGHLSKHRSRDIYVLDPSSGKHVLTLLLPEPSHNIHFDRRNNFYCAAEEGTCVKKYRLIYRFKKQ